MDEKRKKMDALKGYVVENESMRYLGEVWTERQLGMKGIM